MRKFRRRPSIEILETRSLLTSIPYATFLEGKAELLRAFHHQPQPALITGAQVNPNPVILGNTFMVSLINSPSPYFQPRSTSWSHQIFFRVPGQTYSSPVTVDSGSTLYLTMNASIPGFYAITAVTTYMSINPNLQPPPPTTTTLNVTVNSPSTVTKGSGPGSSAALGMTILMVDPVFSADGRIGAAGGSIEEKIDPFTWWDNEAGGNTAWGSSGYPSLFIGLSGTAGAARDQQNFNLDTIEQGIWYLTDVGETLATFTQELRYVWQMPTLETGTILTFTQQLNSLSWTLTKSGTSTWSSI
jgi:hypothetical protein